MGQYVFYTMVYIEMKRKHLCFYYDHWGDAVPVAEMDYQY